MTTPQPDQPDMMDLTVDWLDAVLSSASTDVVGVANWWDRARTAVETAAAGAEHYPHACAIAARKLQIDTYSSESSEKLTALAEAITPRFEEWRQLCTRDAIYAVALLRVRRSTRNTTRKAAK